jgi:hypothetical protein
MNDEQAAAIEQLCVEAEQYLEMTLGIRAGANVSMPVWAARALLAAREREQGLREACKAARIQLGGLCQAIGEYCDGSDADVLNMLDAVLETGGPT